MSESRFFAVDSTTGEVRDVGAPDTRTPEKAPVANAEPTVKRGGERHIVVVGHDGSITEKVLYSNPTPKATAQETASVAQATSLDSLVTDISGDRIPVRQALQLGWVRQTSSGSYEATEEGKAYLQGFTKAAEDAKPTETAANTNTQEQQPSDDAPAASDPFAHSEESQAFVEKVVSVVGDAPALHALVGSLVDGNESATEKLAADLASASGMEPAEFQKQYQGLVEEKLDKARELVSTETGFDAEDVESFETWLREDPKRLRDVRNAIADGDKETVLKAARAYNESSRWENVEIASEQIVFLNGRPVPARVYRDPDTKRYMVNAEGHVFTLSAAKVSQFRKS